MRMTARRTTKVVVEPTTEEGGEAGAAFCRSPKGRPRFGRSTLSQLRLCTLGTRRSPLRVSHRETWPSQPRGACSEVPLCVANAENLVDPRAAGRIDFGDIAFRFADQRARNRRADRDLPVLDIGFVVADDLIAHALAGVGVFQLDRRAKDNPALAVNRARVDHMRVGELVLDVADARFDEALPIFRGIVI